MILEKVMKSIYEEQSAQSQAHKEMSKSNAGAVLTIGAIKLLAFAGENARIVKLCDDFFDDFEKLQTTGLDESDKMMAVFIDAHGTQEDWEGEKTLWFNALASFKLGWEAGKEYLK